MHSVEGNDGLLHARKIHGAAPAVGAARVVGEPCVVPKMFRVQNRWHVRRYVVICGVNVGICASPSLLPLPLPLPLALGSAQYSAGPQHPWCAGASSRVEGEVEIFVLAFLNYPLNS